MFVELKSLPEAPVKELTKDQEICLKAADYIDKHGWCQRNRQVGKRVCLLGAIFAGVGESPFSTMGSSSPCWGAWTLVNRKYNGTSKLAGCCPISFNDNACTTKEQVTALLRSVV